MRTCRTCKQKLIVRDMRAYSLKFAVCDKCKHCEPLNQIEAKDKAGKKTLAKADAYYSALNAAMETDREKISFRVLVWGPGSDSYKTYGSRLQIRDTLKITHEPRFSEDFEYIRRGSPPLATAEHAQLKDWAQLAVVIVESHGSIGELATFQYLFDKKSLIWFPIFGEGGFVDTAFRDLVETNGAKWEIYKLEDLEVGLIEKMTSIWVLKWQECQYLIRIRIEALKEQMI